MSAVSTGPSHIRSNICIRSSHHLQGFLRSTNHLLKILHSYSSSAGQIINTTKSTIIYHSRMKQHYVDTLHQFFNMYTTSTPPIYLGVQFKNGRTSFYVFDSLLHRLARKAQIWMKKCLTQEGRFILIKTSLTPTSNLLMETQLFPSMFTSR